jgi:hypothetical protein
MITADETEANMSFLQQGRKYMFSRKNIYFAIGTRMKQQTLNIPAA